MASYLITGGTGSLGKAIAPLIKGEVRIFSRNEYWQWLMRREFLGFKYYIGDVRDKDRVREVMDGVNHVIHCAALKHVPVCEENITEAIKTNIDGSRNVVECAKEIGITKVLNVSTDKAVEPINTYGATKFIAEQLFLDAGFSSVRLVNLEESHGNVVELFKKQASSGTLTITHPDATRYWMTLEDAARFTVECLDKMKGGEVFIPEVSEVKITDIAERIAPNANWEIIGLRKGEKVREKLC